MTKAPAFASNDLALVRPNPLIVALAATPLLGALALVVAGLAVSPFYFSFAAQAAILGALLTTVALRTRWRAVIEPLAVRAGEEGVTIGDRFLPRAEIRAGFVLPGSHPRVILRRRLRLPVEIQVGSTTKGRQLLRALGLDASQTVAVFRTLSRALAKRRYGLALGGAFAGVWVGFMGARGHSGMNGPTAVAFAAMVLAMLAVFFVPTTFSVGADGVALRWLWTRRFIGYDEIDVVSRFDRGWGRDRISGLRLTLRSNEEVLVPITRGTWASNDGDAAIIEERIEEAMQAFRQGGGEADAALLRRGDRGLGQWVAALRSIGAGSNADLRTAPFPRERLFRIVEDPACSASDRAAAAVALGADLDDDARARLRSAAEATAAPKLRIAIEKAAGDDTPAELEAALAEIEGIEEAQEERR
jgi:hypothetical protein